jgi:hypothetical protein
MEDNWDELVVWAVKMKMMMQVIVTIMTTKQVGSTNDDNNCSNNITNKNDESYTIPPHHNEPQQFFYDKIISFDDIENLDQLPINNASDKYWCLTCNNSVSTRTKHGDRHHRFFN